MDRRERRDQPIRSLEVRQGARIIAAGQQLNAERHPRLSVVGAQLNGPLVRSHGLSLSSRLGLEPLASQEVELGNFWGSTCIACSRIESASSSRPCARLAFTSATSAGTNRSSHLSARLAAIHASSRRRASTKTSAYSACISRLARY